MPFGPENSPWKEPEIIEAEKKPRTGVDILTARTYIGKLLNESLTNKKLRIAEIINNTQKYGSKLANTKYRYWLEYGKEDALRYALNHKSNLEDELKLKDKITGDDYLQNDSDQPTKNPQEVGAARIIVSKRVDLAYSQAKWFGVDTSRVLMDKQKPESVEQFARVAGFYQGLSFLLGKEHDGGMAEFIAQSDPKDFKVPPHP